VSAPRTTHEAAARELARGHQPVPVPRGQKGPTTPAWGERRYAPEDVPGAFASDGNIGVLVGAASGNVVDADLDCAEAVALAPVFLPPTDMRHGRPSRPGSHWWYRTDVAMPHERFADDEVLVELRSSEGDKQAQTLIPPSIHPDGEPYTWDSDGEPAQVTAAELHRAVVDLAAATLIARALPDNRRHDFALALGSVLLRGGLDADRAHKLIEAGFRVGGSQDPTTRAATVYDTARKIEAGEPTTGVPTLMKALGRSTSFGAAESAETFEKNLRAWLDLKPPATAATPYEVHAGRICRRKKVGDDFIWEPLCNVTACITSETTYDDGAERRLVFAIEGALDVGTPLPQIEVAAAEFEAMTWPLGKWGALVNIYHGRDNKAAVRDAIQRSSTPTARTIYQHTGWRMIDGQRAYLHAGGAVGADGVCVDSGVGEYRLPDTTEDAKGAVQLSLSLLDCGPDTVMFPLLASVYVAPLGEAMGGLPFTTWVHGSTGNLKSTIAALAQQHFGAGFSLTSLPGSYFSTDNAIEALLHRAKDVLCTVDDVKPPANQRDVYRQNDKSDRMLRSVGNGAHRARLTHDLKERVPRPPRCMTLVTAETPPPAGSGGARCVPVEVMKAGLDLGRLTLVQQQAGRLSHAMRGYIEYLLPRLDTLNLAETIPDVRSRLSATGQHLRQPDALARLLLGFVVFMQYAVSVGAVTRAEADALEQRAEAALRSIGASQATAMKEDAPEEQFLDALRTALMQGRAWLAVRGNLLGSVSTRGTPVGWTDGKRDYLLATAAFDVVRQHWRQTGGPHLGDSASLKRALVEAGHVIPNKQGKADTKTKVDGSRMSHRVLVLRQSLVPVPVSMSQQQATPAPPTPPTPPAAASPPAAPAPPTAPAPASPALARWADTIGSIADKQRGQA
jgi:hypothetical protein